MKETEPYDETLTPFDYAVYEERCRDRQWNRELLLEYVPYFRECRQVLDVACGPGLFLELLAENNIPAIGVERNPTVVSHARAQGSHVVEADVFSFLAGTLDMYDGIFCSHLIEHLPFEQVLRLIELLIPRLTAGGTFALVFPNPESMRMQLFGFWRDPEHVRFYHPELIEAVCKHYGLTIEHSNRFATPFALAQLNTVEATEVQGENESKERFRNQEQEPMNSLRELFRVWYGKVLRGLRLISKSELARELSALESRLRREREAAEQEHNRWADQMTWALNRMWSWPDNALIVCRKTK
jgi:O-antigen chain-terminating methyltransferase